MNTTSLIKEKLDVERLLHHYQFEKIKDNGNTLRACCKIHDGNNPTAFVINKETGLWYCHTGNCGGGDVFTLVQKMENIDFITAVRWVVNFFNVNIEDLHLKRKANYLQELQKFINTLQIKKKYLPPPFLIDTKIQKVIKYRNFKIETLQHFSVGYVKKIHLQKYNGNYYTLKNRIIFPIKFNNVIVGASLRKTFAKDYPKWSHQPIHLKTKNILYNYDEIMYKNSIVVCEGINDVLAFYEINIPAVATFGAHISKEQYYLLLKTGADLTFAFDGDAAGQNATQLAIKLFQNKANISFIPFKLKEDPESIPREVLKDRYLNNY